MVSQAPTAIASSRNFASALTQAILGYRYWMDEPGNDVQWYFSENHALLFHTAAYLAGHLLPDARFARSGRTGARSIRCRRAARPRTGSIISRHWEMAEFNSAPYFPIDLKGLMRTVRAGARRRHFAAAPARPIVRLLEIVARSAHHGVLTAAQGRSYEHSLRAARSLELSGICRMLWGKGNYGMRFHALPQLGAVPPRPRTARAGEPCRDRLAAPATPAGSGISRKGTTGSQGSTTTRPATSRWAAPPATAGTSGAIRRRFCTCGSATIPDAQIWINHPGEVMQSGYGRPSYWGGSGTLPRVHQYRGLAVVVFDCADEQPDFTHAWFPRSAFDEFARRRRCCACAEADRRLRR